jgi:hypothetical protein
MKNRKKTITRRDFIKDTGCAALGLAIGLPVLTSGADKNIARAKVILVRNKNVVNIWGKINGKIVQEMLDQAVTALFARNNLVDCWKQIIKPDDIVGIKTNEWQRLPTTRQVERAIKNRIMAVGVPEKNIGIDDRGVLGHPIFEKATALINARPMRTHAWSGVGSLIKNYITFVPKMYEYHDNSCADLGAIWHLPIVKDKTRLNVLVMLTPLFYGVGAHHFDSTYVWNYGGLIVGTDPVAVDTVGLRILQIKRKEYFGKDKPIKPLAHHIAFADKKYGLGTSDLEKIDLVKLGYEDGVLI